MIAPKVPLVRDGQILSTNLVNSMIGRIEYAAELLRQYKCISGEEEIYVEPHFDGTRVSYLQQVAGGATPLTGRIVPTDDYGYEFIKPNILYEFPPFTGPGTAPGFNISNATTGYILISGQTWEFGVFAPDNGFTANFGPPTQLNLPIVYGFGFNVTWISTGFLGPVFPFTGGTLIWVP